MPGEIMKMWWTALLAVSMLVFPSRLKHIFADGDPQVPCFFIFGDSLADNGNNNFLPTLAKVNYPPYGIDFPDGPTGRFCNGRTIVDIIAEILGFDNYIPPFATANGMDILIGVNYASGSAGIRDETGQELGECISFNRQLQHHYTTVSRLVDILGDYESAAKHLNKCLYSVGMGSNDYINNYFKPEYYPTSLEHTLEQYTGLLMEDYARQLTTLYEYGARKFAVFGLGKIGCTPNAIDTSGTSGSACVEIMNNASLLFNSRLKSLVDQLNRDLSVAQFIYVNYYGIGEESALFDSFKVDNAACCVVEDGRCIQNQSPCPNRTEYVFWDSFHPTEALNVLLAARSYNALHSFDAYPFDIRHLILLDGEGGGAAAAM